MYFQSSVVLAVFHDGDVHFAKLFTDGPEVRAVTGISAVVNLLLWRDEHEAAPQGAIAFDAAAGEVTCRQNAPSTHR